MATPRPWTVLPHSPLQRHEENLWTVEGSLEGGKLLSRRMALVKRPDGSLVIHNAMALRESEMKEIEAWGEPRVLIVPNGFHRMDAHAFKQRYPKLQVFCPASDDARVREVVEVDGHYDTFPQDDTLSVEPLEGLNVGEGVFIVRSGERTSLIFNDILFNMEHVAGPVGFFMRFMLSATGGLKVNRLGNLFMIRDHKALSAHLERLASLPGLARLIIMHGAIVEPDAAAALSAVARDLRKPLARPYRAAWETFGVPVVTKAMHAMESRGSSRR
jgi:hypothetical protein